MFGFTKLCAIVGGVSGIALSSALFPIATQAKEDWLMAQAAPPAEPNLSLTTPASSVRPNQATTPTRTLRIPAPSTQRTPIEPFPMPGDYRPPLPNLPAPPDIRTMPRSNDSGLSGISGKVSFTPLCSVTAPMSTCATRPYTGVLKISTASRNQSFRTAPDAQGNFQVRLTPGLYVIEPDAPNFPIGTGQTFSVINSVVRQMEFNFQGALPR